VWKKRKIHSALVIVAVLTTVAYPRAHEQKRKKEPVPSGDRVLWMDPGDPSNLDFENGVGGVAKRPQPPFRFISSDTSGTTAKINVQDARGAMWNVKWGGEAHSSTFCTRLLWACGYFANTEYFIESGRIEDAHGLKRASGEVSHDGSFVNARFQLRTDSPKYLEGQSWTWVENPFTGSRELNGLKVLMLLVSNWDAKDARNGPGSQMDTNLAILLDDSAERHRLIYFDDDWGASMGKWGNFFGRSKWDCDGFSKQTPHFVEVGKDGLLEWGFKGKHRKDITDSIRPSDVRWLLQYLGRISDAQIQSGLRASGATPSEVACYTQNLRARIDQLYQITLSQ
jgi:hypothetical protein